MGYNTGQPFLTYLRRSQKMLAMINSKMSASSVEYLFVLYASYFGTKVIVTITGYKWNRVNMAKYDMHI